MKILNYLILIFISIISSVKADLNQNIIFELKKGGKLIFIRHAYAPGGSDPENFDLDDCATQRNLSKRGQIQAIKIGSFTWYLISHISNGVLCQCLIKYLIRPASVETFLVPLP